MPMAKNKYNNVRCSYNGVKFQSMLERDFYIWISKHAEKYGFTFEFQVPYQITSKSKYFADFVLTSKDKVIVIDVKSKATITQVFKLKKDIMFAKHNIDVKIVFTINDLIKLLR